MRDLHILFAALMLGAMGSTPAYAMGPGVVQAVEAQKVPEPMERAEGVIYVGDSRFNGMEMYLGKGGEFVIAKDSMGFHWLMHSAVYRIAEVKQTHPEITQWTIVSGLGVNDLHNADHYIQAYRAFEEAGDKVIAMSVNPSSGKRNPLNKEIDAFNKKLADSGLDYLDMNSHLKDVGYLTVDGLHYRKDTYLEIWNELNHYIQAERDREEAEVQAADIGDAAGAAGPVDAVSAWTDGVYTGWLCIEGQGGAADVP